MPDKTFTSATLSSADTNTYLSHTGDAWNTWTPTVTQSGSVTVTVNTATYYKSGRNITCRMQVTVTGSGTASNAVVIGGLPATVSTSVGAYGQGYLFDSSVPTTYPAIIVLASSTSVNLASTITNANDLRLGVTSFTAALASGDIINCSFTYEST